MSELEVGFRDIAVSLVLVAVVVVVSLWRHLDLEGSVVWAAARAVAQLVLVGAGLSLVIGEDRPLAWSWLWVVAMAVVAAEVVRRRAPGVGNVFPLAVLAFAASGAITLGVLFGLGIFPAEPRTVVPFAGLVVGNTMRSAVLAVHRVTEELRDKRAEVEARLALAHPAPVAASPYIRSALRDALIPQIDGT